MTISEKVEKWMKRASMGQEALAAACEMSQSAFSNLLSGRTRSPSYKLLIRLSRVMKCRLDWLLDEDAGWPLQVEGPNAGVTLSEEEQKLLVLIRDINGMFGEGAAHRRLLDDRGDSSGSGAVTILKPTPPAPQRKVRDR